MHPPHLTQPAIVFDCLGWVRLQRAGLDWLHEVKHSETRPRHFQGPSRGAMFFQNKAKFDQEINERKRKQQDTEEIVQNTRKNLDNERRNFERREV
jgi:hypothetical protein